MGQMCEGETPRMDRITSDCVETTAYTLLALLEAGETDRTACLAQWLIKQQNSFGSFGSSQVNHWLPCLVRISLVGTLYVVGMCDGHTVCGGHV